MEIDRRFFASVDSTNDYAKRNCHSFKRDRLTALIAHEQTAGRGRGDRKWLSPPNGSLYATFCNPCECPFPNLAQLLTLAAHRVLPRLAIKWPNDLLLDGKKVGGVLAEYSSGFAINGIGINLAPLPLETATSLSASKEELLDSLIAEYLSLLSEGFSPFVDEYRRALVHRSGEPIQFHIGSQKISATFLSLADDGAISIATEGGKVLSLHSGELLKKESSRII